MFQQPVCQPLKHLQRIQALNDSHETEQETEHLKIQIFQICAVRRHKNHREKCQKS